MAHQVLRGSTSEWPVYVTSGLAGIKSQGAGLVWDNLDEIGHGEILASRPNYHCEKRDPLRRMNEEDLYGPRTCWQIPAN